MRKPTVSELIGLLDKPALLKWANNLGLKGVSIDEHKRLLASKGTSLHRQIKDYLEKNVSPTDKILKEKVPLFKKKIKLISVEEPIETDYFIGRLDVRFEYKGSLYISDFKSSKSIYLENKLQLCAYKMAYPDCKVAITQIPNMITTPLNLDFEKGVEILKALSIIYNLKEVL